MLDLQAMFLSVFIVYRHSPLDTIRMVNCGTNLRRGASRHSGIQAFAATGLPNSSNADDLLSKGIGFPADIRMTMPLIRRCPPDLSSPPPLSLRSMRSGGIQEPGSYRQYHAQLTTQLRHGTCEMHHIYRIPLPVMLC